jgi:hypothetical protein
LPKEIRENVEAEPGQYELLLEDYNQWLGSILRNSASSKDPEWNKKTVELRKS